MRGRLVVVQNLSLLCCLSPSFSSRLVLTRGEVLLDVLDGAALGVGVQEQQQDGLQNADHVVEGQGPDQPALGRGTHRPVRTAQAVHHNTQGPATQPARWLELQRGLATAWMAVMQQDIIWDDFKQRVPAQLLSSCNIKGFS